MSWQGCMREHARIWDVAAVHAKGAALPEGRAAAAGRSHASKRPLAHAPALQHARWGQDAPDMSLRLQASAADMRTWGARL